MSTQIPSGLSSLFGPAQFRDYPIVEISQRFFDERGQILNIADGTLGDVAFITSNRGAIRANHIHINDWHLTYLIKGHLLYQWDELTSNNRKSMMEIKAGQLFFTPPNIAHKMTFLEESSFIAVSGMNRDQATYESDTRRLESDYFDDARF